MSDRLPAPDWKDAQGRVALYRGDCQEVMREMPDSCVDAIVTDPPYGLRFMGKHWDCDVPGIEIWREALRVLKPGGHLLCFAGTRTHHRMACAIEDAGFEIRDMIAWVYGSGFPKSLDVSKAIDKAAGAERRAVGRIAHPATPGKGTFNCSFDDAKAIISAPATEEARRWSGWGTALKPALEPISLARKPLIGTVAANVQAHGTGALNVDGCRVGANDNVTRKREVGKGGGMFGCGEGGGKTIPVLYGRFPANLIHDGSAEVVGMFPQTISGKPSGTRKANHHWDSIETGSPLSGFGDSGSAARFFYAAKASKADRDEGCDGLPLGEPPASARSKPADGRTSALGNPRRNHHPTVKPAALMRYLCRLITPPDGIVLDPFMGSGSTGKAAILEGFRFIGIERESEYIEIAKARIAHAIEQADSDLFTATGAAQMTKEPTL